MKGSKKCIVKYNILINKGNYYDVKFTINKDNIEILVYASVKNEAKIIH